jgi:DNA-binding MarR family transcriptional regulator
MTDESKANEYKNVDLWMMLGRTYRLIAELQDTESKEFGISRHQTYILFIILALGNNVTATEISRHTHRKKNTVSEILNRMVKNGLVKKVKDPEVKSRKRISVTEKGLEAYERSKFSHSINRVLSVLSEKKHKQLQSCLEILLDTVVKELAFDREKLVLPSTLASKMVNSQTPKILK